MNPSFFMLVMSIPLLTSHCYSEVQLSHSLGCLREVQAPAWLTCKLYPLSPSLGFLSSEQSVLPGI